MDDLQKFKELFVKEASSLIDSLEEILLDLEKNANNQKRIEEVFRVMHTLKGVGSMYGYTGISDLTHGLENIYDNVRNGKNAVTPDIIEITFQSIDHLYALLEDPDVKVVSNQELQKQFQERISAIVNSSKGVARSILPPIKKSEKATFNIVFQPKEEIIDRRISVLYSFKDLAELGEIKAIKSLASEDNSDRWSLFFVGCCTREEVEEALMFIWEYCTIEKIADFDLFDENELNERQQFIRQYESSSESHLLIDNSTVALSSDALIADSISKPEVQSTGVLESIRQNMNRISVDAEKIDYLMYLVSELITTNSQIALMTQSSEFDSIRMQIEKLDQLSKQFRNNALEIRLIPIRDVVPKFQRMIRDVSRQLGKEVEFITEGMETELDKSSIDIIVEPLLHIIRNSLDHGIETPEVRLDRGKPSKGIIKLSAWYSGNNVFVRIDDDGKGIDKSEIFKKAVEKGLIEANAKLSDQEIYDLMCMPGFSTAREITSISGRGVGMDVVKQKIAEVRGELEISSIKEKGTTMIIKLQQSVAILDTLLVKTENMKWLIPLSDVEVCSQVEDNELVKGERLGTLEYAGQMIPFVYLRTHFQHEMLNKYKQSTCVSKMVVLRKNEVRFAVVTDEIVGQHQAVLKNLGRLLKHHPEISAASLLGNGEVAFLLDTNQFYQNFSKK